MSTLRPLARARTGRLLCLLGSVAILTALALMPPALPDFGPSLATPLTTSTLTRLALLLLWIVCLLLAVALLQRALRPERSLRPPAWATRTGPRPRRVHQLTRHDAAQMPRLVVSRDPVPQLGSMSPGGRSEGAQADSAAPIATICLLGPVTIRGIRRPRRTTTLELLAYLALHKDGADRDRLLEEMWPGQDPRRTRPRLWKAVTEARRLLGDAFERRGDRYTLDRTHVLTDVDQLEQLLGRLQQASPADARALAERALALWRGKPMSAADYAWADGHIRQLQSSLANLAVTAAQLRLQAGDARGALHVAEHGLKTDDLNEHFVRIALEAEAALGNREALTDRYQTLCQLLDARLGLEPERATRVLYRNLLSQDASGRMPCAGNEEDGGPERG